METIIVFFRDTLSGTLYVVVSIVCSILICLSLFLLIFRHRKAKDAAEKYEASHIVIINAKGEEETIEITPSASIQNGMSGLPAIVSSATTSVQNVPASSAVAAIAYPDAPAPEVPNNKPVVMINPLEVAVISSSLNVSGVTSVQKSALGISNTDHVVAGAYDPSKAQAGTAGTVVSSQVVSALVGSSEMENLSNTQANTQVQADNQNFTN